VVVVAVKRFIPFHTTCHSHHSRPSSISVRRLLSLSIANLASPLVVTTRYTAPLPNVHSNMSDNRELYGENLEEQKRAVMSELELCKGIVGADEQEVLAKEEARLNRNLARNVDQEAIVCHATLYLVYHASLSRSLALVRSSLASE
jgi:hypothetical protein